MRLSVMIVLLFGSWRSYGKWETIRYKLQTNSNDIEEDGWNSETDGFDL